MFVSSSIENYVRANFTILYIFLYIKILRTYQGVYKNRISPNDGFGLHSFFIQSIRRETPRGHTVVCYYIVFSQFRVTIFIVNGVYCYDGDRWFAGATSGVHIRYRLSPTRPEIRKRRRWRRPLHFRCAYNSNTDMSYHPASKTNAYKYFIIKIER